jgi:hypothetical protein
MNASDEAKLAEIDTQARLPRLMVKQAPRKITGAEAVAFCDLAHVVDGSDAASPTHRLNRYSGLSRDVLHQVLGQHSAFDIGGTAGGEVDNDVKSLALVERSFFGGNYKGAGYQQEGESDNRD